MSDVSFAPEDLEQLKLNELKKLCKKQGLGTSGTKADLIARLVESKDSFSILQPGEEAQLLGDDDAGDDSTVFRVTDSSLDSLATPVGKASNEIVDNNSSSTITQIHKSTPQVAGVKRSSDALQTTSNENSEASADSKEITSASNEIHMNENSTCSELQVLAKRANRFGLSRPAGGMSFTDDKLVARAKRFGLPVAEGPTGVDGLRPITTGTTVISTDEADKLRRRAERFGEVTSKPVQKGDDDARKAMRLERFGASALSGTTTANSSVKIRSDEEAKAARAEKFGIETDEAKLQKRKARFGLA